MGIRKLMLVVCLLLGTAVLADPTGMYVKSGGTLAMIDNHPDIALRDEVVSFLIGYSGAAVRVELNFENTGAAQEVLMGFPVFPGVGAVSEVRATVDDAPVTTTETAQPVENSPVVRVGSYSVGAGWHLFKVPFEAHQKRHLRISYNQRHAEGYGRPALRYWLGTGANWKDNINWVEIRVAAVDPVNWSRISTGFAQTVNGKLVYRIEDYDGRPGDFTISGSSAAASLAGPAGASGGGEGGQRVYGVFGDKVLAQADFLASALRTACTKSADGTQITFALPQPLTEADIADPAALVAKTRANSDQLSRMMFGWTFSPAREKLKDYVPGTPPEPALLKGCVDGLNRFYLGGTLLASLQPLLGDRAPSERLRALKDTKPQGWDLVRFNRLALSELLPGVIRAGEVVPAEPKATVPVLPGPEFAEAFPVAEPVRGKGDWVDVQEVARELGLKLEMTDWEGSKYIRLIDPRMPRG